MTRKQIIFFTIFLLANTSINPYLYPTVLASTADNYKEIIIEYQNNKLETIKVSEFDFAQKIKELKQKNNIKFAEASVSFTASIIPSDQYFEKQWYLKRIKAMETWDEYWDANSITIAIIDSGVQINHPDLKDNIWINASEIANNKKDDDNNGFIDDYNGWDFLENTPDPNPKFEKDYTKDGIMHGTVVAGVASASGNNFLGVTGTAWNAKIMPLRVLNGAGEGNTKSVVRAIDYAIKNGADIINFSFVGSGYSDILNEAIKRAYNAGIVIVAAAGNDLDDNNNGHKLDEEPLYPVCYDGKKNENMIIGVAATDSLDQKANFSGYGNNCIDISAPGISIFNTAVKKENSDIFNNYYDGYWAGTSMAVPMVSGAVALIKATNPHLSRNEIIESLLKNTDNINNLNPEYTNKLGSGRLNIKKAVDGAVNKLKKTIVNLVTAPLSKSNGEILMSDKDGSVVNRFLTFGKDFKGGVNVAVGDVDGDGSSEIVVGAGVGGGPHIRVFKNDGTLKNQFFAFNKNFKGGVNVAVGDVDGDGSSEIVVGAGVGGGPQVRIFNSKGTLKGQHFAYDKKFRGGVNVAVGDLNSNARNENAIIITAPGTGGGPQVKIFDNHFKLRGQFFAYSKNFRGGVDIFLADVDYDGKKEIITGAGPNGAPHVRTFKDNGILVSSFYAFPENFNGGVSVSAIEL